MVGNQGSGKSCSLNCLIEDLKIDNNWIKLKELNKKDMRNLNLPIVGDPEDRVVIFKNKSTQKIVGISTSGDNTEIVFRGLKYLNDEKVDVAIIASHKLTLKYFITRFEPLTIEIGTHDIPDQKLHDQMNSKNSKIIQSLIN
ncbi:hypothetical protein PAF15_07175 [Weissella koreensis]|uniref:hypothetical protein n=1 Tax=Weissella koreensis TaxID=165096 RepID=UPI0022BA33C7|nr:hypothetical protein [Weissella koreensis]MCZ9311719.1 hypothetical protein [Weissella koreensis]